MMTGRWSRRVLHKIALNFEDGTTQFIDADESESIADAAYRQGINVPRTSLINQEHHPIRLHLLVGLSFRQ
jgi:hypothetical protein